ncbi:hypothetical protein C8R45DRAFT_936293, partial [Mycena sanguinolenta]
MSTYSNSSIPNNNGNPPQGSGKGKAKETTPDREVREKEEREERERGRVAWEQAVEDAKTLEERAADEAKKRQQQDLRAAELKELAVASRRQALVEKDERVRDIFARAGNEELAAEDLEELESILRGESPDNSDVPDETNDEADSEPDLNEVQTGRKRKRVTGRRSSAGKAPAKKQRKAETSRKGGEAGRVRKAMRPEEIVWGPAPEPCGRCAGNNRKCQIPTNDPNKAACRQCGVGKNRASGEQAPEDRGSNSAAEDEETVGRKRPSEPPVA